MKILLLTFFTFSIAQACPDLYGVWSCEVDQSGKMIELDIVQRMDRNGYSYELYNFGHQFDTLWADEIMHEYEMQNEDQAYIGFQSGQCLNNVVVQNTHYDIIDLVNQTKVGSGHLRNTLEVQNKDHFIYDYELVGQGKIFSLNCSR